MQFLLSSSNFIVIIIIVIIAAMMNMNIHSRSPSQFFKKETSPAGEVYSLAQTQEKTWSSSKEKINCWILLHFCSFLLLLCIVSHFLCMYDCLAVSFREVDNVDDEVESMREFLRNINDQVFPTIYLWTKIMMMIESWKWWWVNQRLMVDIRHPTVSLPIFHTNLLQLRIIIAPCKKWWWWDGGKDEKYRR